MKNKKISILIPTRNRCEYLIPCIQSCLASNDPDIEVVVSDNNSSDTTKKDVAKIKDSRLVYVNPGKSVCMRKNFEYAVEQATGDYMLIIGDDDGVLSNGLATLRHILEQKEPDIITWRHITYMWPGTQAGGDTGLLKFRARDFFGPLKKINLEEKFKSFCKGGFTNYRDAANIYHGCISRNLIEKIKQQTGEYFQAHSPDIYASIANMVCGKSMYWVRNPITIAGESAKSTGVASLTKKGRNKQQQSIMEDFNTLVDQDTVSRESNFSMKSLTGHTYAILNRSNEILANNNLEINHSAWRNVIISETDRLPIEIRQENYEMIEELFAKFDKSYIKKNYTVDMNEDNALNSQQKRSLKKSGISPEYTGTIFDATQWINEVTGTPYIPSNSNTLNKIAFFIKMVGVRRRFKKLNHKAA